MKVCCAGYCSFSDFAEFNFLLQRLFLQCFFWALEKVVRGYLGFEFFSKIIELLEHILMHVC